MPQYGDLVILASPRGKRHIYRIEEGHDLHTQDGVLCVRAQDITYAETYGRKLLVHTAQGRLELRMTIAALEQALCRDGFFRIHNAYLVSLRHVQSVSGLRPWWRAIRSASAATRRRNSSSG